MMWSLGSRVWDRRNRLAVSGGSLAPRRVSQLPRNLSDSGEFIHEHQDHLGSFSSL